MFRPADPLLRPDRDVLITDDCDAQMLLNPGRILTSNDDPAGSLPDSRELLAVTP